LAHKVLIVWGMYAAKTTPGKRSNLNTVPQHQTQVTHGRGYGVWALCCTHATTGRRLAVKVAYHNAKGTLVAVRVATQAGVQVTLQANQVHTLTLGNTTPGLAFGQPKPW
jgi:hypothetical protein